MTPTLTNTQPGLALETLDATALKKLASSEGPCITIVIPPRHPGSQEGTRRNQLLGQVQAAAEQLKAKGIDAGNLLSPLEDLLVAPAIDAGGPGFVIFRAPDVIGRFRTLREHPPNAVVGHYFRLAPFIPEVALPAEFFLLGFGRKNLRLYRCAAGECEKIDLPAGVPASVEAAEGFDAAEYEANRSFGGPSGSGRVHFGTLSDREAAGEYLNYFIAVVDRGLRPFLAGKPLFLSGVHEELNAYRRVAHYEHILAPEIDGNTEFVPVSELAAQAAKALEADYRMSTEKALAAWREMTDRTRVASGAVDVLRAAREGRIHKLFIPTTETVETADMAEINSAVAQTLRNGGEVLAVPPANLPEVLAAVLRY